MIILITGASHTGKTLLAQSLLEKYKYPYLSIDLLKMGLIRSRHTTLTPEDDEQLTSYLWPIVKEMIKTAIENQQHLIVEGCYIPFDWSEDFDVDSLKQINCYCLIMTEHYIHNHFEEIQAFASAIESRLNDTGCTKDAVLSDNAHYQNMCQKYNCRCILIDDNYESDIALLEEYPEETYMREFFLETKRITFSHWTVEDFDLAMELWGAPEVTRYICASGKFTTREIKKRLDTEINNYQNYGIQYFPMFERGSMNFIGCCGLRPLQNEKNVYEIGFHLKKTYHKQGLAFEAATAMLQYAFAVLGAKEVTAGHHPANTSSQKLLKRLGFEYESESFYEPTQLYHPTYRIKNHESL